MDFPFQNLLEEMLFSVLVSLSVFQRILFITRNHLLFFVVFQLLLLLLFCITKGNLLQMGPVICSFHPSWHKHTHLALIFEILVSKPNSGHVFQVKGLTLS